MIDQTERSVDGLRVNQATTGYRLWQFSRLGTLSPEILVGIVRVTDACVILGTGVAVFMLYFGLRLDFITEVERYFLTSLLAAMLFVAGFHRIEGYSVKQLRMLRWQLTRVAAVWALTISLLLFVAFVGKVSATYSRGWTLCWVVTALALILLERGIVRLALGRWVATGYIARNIAIVGAGEQGERLIAKLQKSQDKSIAIRGVFDDRTSRVPHSICGCQVLGDIDVLLQFARRVPLDEVIITLPLSAEQRLKAIVNKLKVLPADLRLSAGSMAENLPLRGMSYISGEPLLVIADRPIRYWSAVAKWVEDEMLSAVLLLALAPLMVIIALIIKFESRGPILFIQERFGFNNDIIRVYKFRTMYVDRGDKSGAERTVQNDPRITRLGRVLRWLSLDELPQLLNVLKGEMSLVGPRPHAIAMKAGDRLYHEAVEDYAHRHRVKPGITGWAQVNGCRGEIDTIEKARARVELDLYYIENWSLWLDLKTLAMTMPVLLSRQNAY
jgi:Undecaprenyl-phosphate glucose phosphotransferase